MPVNVFFKCGDSVCADNEGVETGYTTLEAWKPPHTHKAHMAFWKVPRTFCLQLLSVRFSVLLQNFFFIYNLGVFG